MADPQISASDRVQELADSGQFEAWPQIAARLASEGYGATVIARIGRDRAKQRLLAARLLEVAKSIEEGGRATFEPKRMAPSLRIDALARRR